MRFQTVLWLEVKNMSQIIDSFRRGTVSNRGYVHGKSVSTTPPSALPRLEKVLLIAITVVVGALAVIFLGMLFRLW